jgi:hypothetical protein
VFDLDEMSSRIDIFDSAILDTDAFRSQRAQFIRRAGFFA